MGRARMSQRLILVSVGLVVLSGCQIPAHQLPAGYSSSDSRFLHAEEQGAPLPVPAWPDEPVPHPPGVFYPQTFQYDPPTKSEFQQAVRVPENPNAGPVAVLICQVLLWKD
jgi:hypothetical protein